MANVDKKLVEAIDNILPQTQCTRCGYPSCLEYANALAMGDAKINQCPPGGEDGINKLASLLNEKPIPLNPANGSIKNRQVALIDEEVCIGCTLCIKACPVDAIIGSNKMMHTVIADACSGCDLCIPVCPVDCISMHDDLEEWSTRRISMAKERFMAKNQRKTRDQQAREARLASYATLKK